MLCVAKVNLSDWPEGTRREVDPDSERVQGLLRGGYIVPLRLPRSPAAQAAPTAPEEKVEALAPDEGAQPARRPQAAPRKAAAKKASRRAEDE